MVVTLEFEANRFFQQYKNQKDFQSMNYVITIRDESLKQVQEVYTILFLKYGTIPPLSH